MRSSWMSYLVLAVLLVVPLAAQAGPRNAALTGTINLNTATEAELQLLPGIGEKKAERIVEVRSKRKFENAEQIRRVKGIGRATYRRLKPYLAVTGNTTLAVATAEATTPAEPKAVTPAPAKPAPSGKLPTPKAPASKPAASGTKTPAGPKAPARA